MTKESSYFVYNLRLTFVFLLLITTLSCYKYDLNRTNPLDSKSKNFVPLPEITTTDPTAIASNSATIGGTVISEGGDNVTARGVCWSTSPNPTLANSKTSDGTGIGIFTSSLTGLASNTTYYVRAYASNILGTAYGNELTFTTSITVTDADGNVYNTVIIGTQVWMKENLKVTHYADGNPIALVEDTTIWRSLGFDGKAYCWYENNSDYSQTYGALYTWAAATNNLSSFSNPSGIQGACPDGWHIPSDEEWKQLELYIGFSQTNADKWDLRGTIEGEKLKSTNGWASDGNGSNETGFTALPGGSRVVLSSPNQIVFWTMSAYGYWWTSSENSNNYAIIRYLSYLDGSITRLGYLKLNGYSVRCVKD